MKKTQAFIAVVIVGIGFVITIVGGIFAYMTLTATPIHPSEQEVSSIPEAAPPRKWTEAAERARQMVRASVVEEPPGLCPWRRSGATRVVEGFRWATS